jgi:hypothetical protein
MGYFSKVCAKTNLPIVHDERGFQALNNVVALLPNGEKITGSYDGYGRVNGIELHECWDDVKFVLQQHYQGEAYNDLGKSGHELGQGHFMDNKFLIYCTIINPDGFKTYARYKSAFKKMANW